MNGATNAYWFSSSLTRWFTLFTGGYVLYLGGALIHKIVGHCEPPQKFYSIFRPIFRNTQGGMGLPPLVKNIEGYITKNIGRCWWLFRHPCFAKQIWVKYWEIFQVPAFCKSTDLSSRVACNGIILQTIGVLEGEISLVIYNSWNTNYDTSQHFTCTQLDGYVWKAVCSRHA